MTLRSIEGYSLRRIAEALDDARDDDEAYRWASATFERLNAELMAYDWSPADEQEDNE